MNAQSLSPDAVARLTPFCDLGAESLAQVVSLGNVVRIPQGPLPAGLSWDQKVVYLLKGQLKLGGASGGVRVIVGGSGDALAPLGSAGLMRADAKAITAVELLWFDEQALDIVVTWDQLVPSPATQAKWEQDQARRNGDVADWRIMSGIFDAHKLASGSFANLPAANIESLLASFRRQSVKAGEVIVRQGDPGDYYYLIERGRAQVTRAVGGGSIELAELKAGDAFGEEALIAEAERNATVTMKTDGELLRLDGADFCRLLREPLLQRLDAREAQRRVAAGALWLDVRFPAEYRHDGLAEAINIPLNELRDAIPSLSREREYIAYCQSGRRSSAAAFLLSQRGLHASLLEGGLKSINGLEKVTA